MELDIAEILQMNLFVMASCQIAAMGKTNFGFVMDFLVMEKIWKIWFVITLQTVQNGEDVPHIKAGHKAANQNVTKISNREILVTYQ